MGSDLKLFLLFDKSQTSYKAIQFKTIKSLVQLKSNWYKKVFRYHFCKLQTLLLMYYDRLPADPDSLTLTKSEIRELLRRDYREIIN